MLSSLAQPFTSRNFESKLQLSFDSFLFISLGILATMPKTRSRIIFLNPSSSHPIISFCREERKTEAGSTSLYCRS